MSGRVEVLNETDFNISEAGVRELVFSVLAAEGRIGSVDVVFVDEPVIAQLNERYRNCCGPTDVLSFSEELGDQEWPDVTTPDRRQETDSDELGEIVISPTVVARYATEEQNDMQEQLAWTLVHGVLHLLGYDHEVDDGEMRERERELLLTLRQRSLVERPMGDAQGQHEAGEVGPVS
jgi:probable rRNA maturation factor